MLYILFSAWAFGDPHYITLDKVPYTFNGLGLYKFEYIEWSKWKLMNRVKLKSDANLNS